MQLHLQFGRYRLWKKQWVGFRRKMDLSSGTREFPESQDVTYSELLKLSAGLEIHRQFTAICFKTDRVI